MVLFGIWERIWVRLGTSVEVDPGRATSTFSMEDGIIIATLPLGNENSTQWWKSKNYIRMIHLLFCLLVALQTADSRKLSAFPFPQHTRKGPLFC